MTATTRYVALLRGVNLGPHAKVPMAGLRELLAALGHGDVKTLLNSGNAVFTAPAGSPPAALADAIAAGVLARFGVATPVIVKTAAGLQAIVAHNPIVPPATDHPRFLVVFAQDAAPLQALAALQPLATAGERFVITDRAAYLHGAGGLLHSRLGEAVLGKTGRGVTARNWATVLKLAALLPDTAR